MAAQLGMLKYNQLQYDRRLRRMASDATLSSHEKMVMSGVAIQGLAHMNLNRYSNILPFDKALAPCSLGYVNASLIRFPEAEYVIAAGPMAEEYYGLDTRPAFWHSVVENEVTIIVALAAFKPGFAECADYLRPQTYGDWGLKILKENISESLTVRDLELTNHNNQERKLIRHFHFLAWPNYSVANPIELCNLIRSVDDEWAGNGRIMVHCSGGIGRSGTFTAAHRTYRCRPQTPDDAQRIIYETVVKLREDRHPWMVEGEEQYSLIHRILATMHDW